MVVVAVVSSFQQQQLSGVSIGQHGGQTQLSGGELGDGLAAVQLLLAVLQSDVCSAQSGADEHGGEAQLTISGGAQQLSEAVAGLAQELILGDNDVVHEDIIDLGAAIADLLPGRGDGVAFAELVNDQAGDQVLAGLLVLQQGEQNAGAVITSVGDEALHAVQLVGAVGLLLQTGLQHLGVRTGVGLGESEGDGLLAAAAGSQILQLLLVVSIQIQSLQAQDVHVQALTDGGRNAAQLLDNNGLLHVAHTQAVILLGEADADEAALSQLLVNVVGQLGMLLAIADLDHLAFFDLFDAGSQNSLSKVLGKVVDHLLVFVQFEFHDSIPPVNYFLHNRRFFALPGHEKNAHGNFSLRGNFYRRIIT